MNALSSLRSAHEAGHMRKQDYIEAIHALHGHLFDYSDFIADTDVEAILIQPDGVYVRSRSHQIDLLIDPRDQHLVPCTLMNFRSYETAETAFLKSIVADGQTVLDIGANCGWYSLVLARHCKGARIHAFEPIPRTHGILERNTRHNGLDNIQTHRLAFSNAEATLEFIYAPSCSGATSLELTGQPGNKESLERISCQATTVDLFCARNDIAPQLIKCDVEGAELMVFQGAGATLATHRPVILVELLRKWSKQFGYHPNEFLALLDSHGYQAYSLDGDGLSPCQSIDEQTIATNFVFLHPRQHHHILGLIGTRRTAP